jgi:hypothetical protein
MQFTLDDETKNLEKHEEPRIETLKVCRFITLK